MLFRSGAYTLVAAPSQLIMAGEETARVELTIAGLNPGETVALSTGPSSPAGLDVVLDPQTIAAPGGKATLTISVRTPQTSQQATFYRIPVRAASDKAVQTTSITVVVNGHELFLPAIRR